MYVCAEIGKILFITTLRSGSTSFKDFFAESEYCSRKELVSRLISNKHSDIVLFVRNPIERYESTVKLLKMVLRSRDIEHIEKLLVSLASPYIEDFDGIPLKIIRFSRIAEYLPFKGFPSVADKVLPSYYTPPYIRELQTERLLEEKGRYDMLVQNSAELSPKDFKEITR